MRYEFIYDYHEEYGFWGLKPLWLDGADPATSMQATHDILEHFNEPITSDTELMALGAMLHVRANGGYFSNRYNNDIGEILEGDLCHVTENQYKYGEISEPGFTIPLEDHVESWITKAIALAIQTMKSDDWEDSYENLISEDPTLALKLRGWLRKGYRRSRNRYRGQSSSELTTAFKVLEKELSKALTECQIAGQTVVVNLIMGNLLGRPINVRVRNLWDMEY